MNLLVIEDDARVADFLERGLRAEGYRTTVARTGNEGLAWARRETFSVVLLDVMLPTLSGIELCQQLRAERNVVPILMLTALGALEDRVAGLRCGADDYLTKPFAFEELLARIESLLRRPPVFATLATQLCVGDLVFDREQMTVKRGDRPIALTAKELALLELLMSSPGKLFSRERILANVWGSHEDPLTNVVDVYIRRLRMKVEGDSNTAMIKTVRGLGYRLDLVNDG